MRPRWAAWRRRDAAWASHQSTTWALTSGRYGKRGSRPSASARSAPGTNSGSLSLHRGSAATSVTSTLPRIRSGSSCSSLPGLLHCMCAVPTAPTRARRIQCGRGDRRGGNAYSCSEFAERSQSSSSRPPSAGPGAPGAALSSGLDPPSLPAARIDASVGLVQRPPSGSPLSPATGGGPSSLFAAAAPPGVRGAGGDCAGHIDSRSDQGEGRGHGPRSASGVAGARSAVGGGDANSGENADRPSPNKGPAPRAADPGSMGCTAPPPPWGVACGAVPCSAARRRRGRRGGGERGDAAAAACVAGPLPGAGQEGRARARLDRLAAPDATHESAGAREGGRSAASSCRASASATAAAALEAGAGPERCAGRCARAAPPQEGPHAERGAVFACGRWGKM